MPLGLPSCWFLTIALTWPGRGLAIIGLGLTLLPLLLALSQSKTERRALWQAVALALAGLIFLIVVLILLATPDGRAAPGSPVSHQFAGTGRFRRDSPANLVPEIEQINLGFRLIPLIDPIMTYRQARRVSVFTLDLYREMERDPDFHRLGSAMPYAYDELFLRPLDAGHYYLYVPASPSDGPRPAIVYLHGAFGPFKTYTYAWSKLADDLGYVIIAPTYGLGQWPDPDGTQTALDALDHALTIADIDPQRIYLAGLSNGGLAVTRMALAAPDRFAGLIFLSPVIDDGLIARPEFQAAWHGRPALVITGQADERLPASYVLNGVAQMQAIGMDVTSILYPGEDHFLFFSQLEAVLDDIADWLQAH